MEIREQDIRWKQRFHNFDRAFVLLRSALEDNVIEELRPLEQEGVIQRFEYTYELAWKTLKDYLEYSGVNMTEPTPTNVFKEAYFVNIIQNQQAFVEMRLARNMLSHCYDFDKFSEILRRIKTDFFPALEELHDFFFSKITGELR